MMRDAAGTVKVIRLRENDKRDFACFSFHIVSLSIFLLFYFCLPSLLLTNFCWSGDLKGQRHNCLLCVMANHLPGSNRPLLK